MLQEFKGGALDFREILELLESRGMEIGDQKRALYVLGNISYCRLKSYMEPFLEDGAPHRFRPGTTLEKVYAAYGFDRRLRELLFHEMEKIEICIRTRFGYFTARTENGYWFTNPDHFKSSREHARLMHNILSEINRSDNDAILRFRKKYSNEFPPCYLTMEATSMGTLSAIYHQMVDGQDKSSLASYFGLDVPTFSSWLSHIVYVRNYCAHHNRLWDKKLSVRGRIPAGTRHTFPHLVEEDTCHIYFTCCVIKYLLDTVRPDNRFALRLRELIEGFPGLETERAMGFPALWKEDCFWRVY